MGVLTLCHAGVVSRVASAQLQPGMSERIVTPAENARGTRLYGDIGMTALDGRRVPAALLDSAIDARTRDWVVSLAKNAVSGLQLDAMGELYVRAGEDERAQAQFAARLATPRLSIGDEVFTLAIATRTFGGNASNQERMRIALRYLAELDALQLPDDLLRIRSRAHAWIGESYYKIGDGASALTHINAAFALVAKIAFESRDVDLETPFIEMADILSGTPRGRATIDSVGQWLLALQYPPPGAAARDSVYYWTSKRRVDFFKQILQQTSYLGREAPVVVAHYWVNAPRPEVPSSEPGAVMKSLKDGMIRVVEFGHMGCPGCMFGLSKMETMRKTEFSNIRWLYVGTEMDMWGLNKCNPDDCLAHYKHFYLDRKGIRGVELALWIGPRRLDPDGGTQQQQCPTFDTLEILTQPLFLVTDGRGIVRHMQIGMDEVLLRRSLQYLAAEAEKIQQPSLPNRSPSAGGSS